MEREDAIALIGFMGAGKTSVGRELARRLEWPLYETDAHLEARFERSIAEIFSAHGETEFRAAESAALAEMPRRRAIVATGGGIIARAENLEMLRRFRFVVYLCADEATLFERVSHEGGRRPLLETEDPRATLARLLAERAPWYESVATLTIDTTGRTVAEVAERILRDVG